ncbi:MAG TPA: ATP-binding protein, partial [Chloroflexota bacterium]|nr:ATP-binding protein [Chloroflexota bacterium]
RPRDAQEPLGPVDLAQVVEQTIAFTRTKWKDDAQARGRTISLGTDLPPAPLVNGNSAELREALTNLVFNAVDALPEGGTITIRTRNEGQRVLLEVHDTGIGMPEHVRQRCLEPFYSTKGARGTGLGLAMVHGTVERHQGQLEIESTPGEGTTIRLRLPVYDNEGKPPAPAPPPEANAPLSVLVIDDESAVRAVVAAMLTAEGHTVIQAATGQEGIERMAEGNVDLVVTDRAMPGGISGEQVARAVKQCTPETPVILLTGYGDLMAAAGEHPPDVDAILSKPVSLGMLRSTIASLRAPAISG